jgi:hypothetical protein
MLFSPSFLGNFILNKKNIQHWIWLNCFKYIIIYNIFYLRISLGIPDIHILVLLALSIKFNLHFLKKYPYSTLQSDK